MSVETPENNDSPGGGSKDYREAVEERVKKEADALASAKEIKDVNGDRRDGKITSRFVLDCLYANELGDGMLYAAIHKDKFLYNKSAGNWLVWAGHYWEEDIMDAALSAVENVALRYLEEAQKIVGQIGEASKSGDKSKAKTLQKTQGNLYKRVFRLRKGQGRKGCVEFTHTNPVNPLSIKGDEFDAHPYLFACKNGVIDLRTGSLRPGRQEDFISKASPIEFTGIDTIAPYWEKALNEIFQDRQSMVDFIQRLFGYSMAGLTAEAFLPVFFGQGRNGKSTIVEIISHVMGKMAAPIRAEMLLDQGHLQSSAGASPDIMALRGLRLAFASETDQGRRFSTSKVQWLTGSDTMTGRYLYDKRDVEFKPTHTLALLTNHKPNVSDNDYAFWERVCLIPFPLSFVTRKPDRENERPADINLRQKLLAEESGVLAWLVRGFMQWQERGLDPPPEVIDATKEYRKDEDLIDHFVTECCYTSPDAETSAKDLYAVFKKWWEENVSRKSISQKRFGGMMTKKFKRQKSGIYMYLGIGINDDWN